jgi:hypothetical protein
MKTVLFLLFPVLIIVFGHKPTTDVDKFISIEKLIKNNAVKGEIKGLGGYQEYCIGIDITNNTADTLPVLIEPGRRLVSDDSTEQDILLVKEIRTRLLPYENKKLKGYGFCCEASMHAPGLRSGFSVGYMAPKPWIQLAEVINNNNFPPEAIQNAVWVFSNDHPISSIYGDKAESIDLLRRTVSSIKGIELPWYSIAYEKDTAMLFSGRAERLWGTLEYHLKTNAIITINVRNKSGAIVAILMKAMAHNPGPYLFDVDLPVKNWQKGDYEVSIYEDYSNLNLRKKFTL